jgi:hypothetical protein
MDYTQNAESLAARMNKLTATLDLSDDLLIEGDDIVEYVEENTKKIELFTDSNYADIMNLEIMTQDFKFVRETLKEVTENARRVQNAVTLDLLSDDDTDSRASLIISFAELSKAITDAQKLYVLSYKEMSTTLLNLDKIKKNDKDVNPSSVTNNLHIYDPVTTTDLIKKLKGK